MKKSDLRRKMTEAVNENDLALVEELWKAHPELHDPHWLLPPTWLSYVCLNCPIEMVALFLRLGVDVNVMAKVGGPAIEQAILSGRMELVRYLIAEGADVTLGRPLMSAILYDGDGLEFVKLLVAHGIDVNQSYSVLGDEQNRFTALSFALMHGKQEIADYLRSQGALTIEELPRDIASTTKGTSQKSSSSVQNAGDEVVVYFSEHFGPVDPLALMEIVPGDPPITIHVVRASQDRSCVTLFTTGMSAQLMNVPRGQEAFRCAEMFLQLPRDWPLDKKSLATSQYGWPIEWLYAMARYPHQQQTWLGGPATITANGDPPEPLAPGLKFTSLLLFAERSLVRQDGETVQLFRLIPLYTEERALEIQQDLPALMNALDDLSTPFVIDLERPNAGLTGKARRA